MTLEWDEWFDKEEKRDSRKERKILKKTDRSRFKKTDRHKFEKEGLHENIKAERSDFLEGRVISIQSQGVEVDSNGKIYNCQLRGLLKRDISEDKNLLVIGDFVLFTPLPNDEGSIQHVEPRKSFLARADNLSRRKQQLIAANIDQVLITVSVVFPPLKPYLVDRYIIAARKGNMEPVLVVNKIDLLASHEDEKELAEEFIQAYRKSGIKVFPVSSETKEGLKPLLEYMDGKTSVFSGQSGVGKTSLINEVLGVNLKVGKATMKTGKGAHTTTTASLIPLPTGGFCIDTPGIRSFGVWNLTAEEIRSYFPDILEVGLNCQFPDCTHIHETQCRVIEAVEKGQLSPLRYASYVYLINSLDDKHARR